MPIKLTAESFLAGVRQSGLVDDKQLDAGLSDAKSAGVSLDDSQAIAEALVAREVISHWQSEKLLQGKHKGFILGRYRLVDLLGRGEMSSVYLAEHVMMKRRCAVKVLPAHRVKDTSYLGRFHREAEAVASLDHPNIVRAYDVGQENEAGAEIHFLVMEYVKGKSLDAVLSDGSEHSLIEIADYIRQAAEGLAHAHENGLVHRDIKPGNLLINDKQVVKLLDLGLARFFKSTDEESLTIKHDEKVLGTADYLAPEQAVDSHAVDERADIYSLGCTFYYALTGQPPFTDGTLVQRLLAHQTKVPQPIQRLRPEVPDSLTDIIDRMMQKQPEDRYQTAADVAQALSQWLIDNDDANWRRSHAEIVARLMGIDAVLAMPASSVLMDDHSAAVVDIEAPLPTDASIPNNVVKDAVTSSLDDESPDNSIDPKSESSIEQETPESIVVNEPATSNDVAVGPKSASKSGASRKKKRRRKKNRSAQPADSAAAVAAAEEVPAITPSEAVAPPTPSGLPGYRFAGIPINAGTGLIATLVLLAAIIAGGWGLNLLADTDEQNAELLPAPFPGEFNEPAPGESVGPFDWTGE